MLARKKPLPELMPEYKELIDKFLGTKKRKKLSELTLYSYQRFLYHFFSGFTKEFKSLDYNDILTRLEEYETGKQPSSIHQRISILQGFLTFCFARGYLTKVPIKKWWRPDVPESLPKYLESEEHAKAKIASEKLNLRDRALFEFLESSGCRRAEASSLKIENLDLNNRVARVLGKGNKLRKVDFSVECAMMLQDYLGDRVSGTGPVFLNKKGKGISDRWVYFVTDKVGKASKLRRRLGPHVLRHTWACSTYSKEEDLEFVRISLGHKDPKITRIYVKIPTNKRRLLYQRYVG